MKRCARRCALALAFCSIALSSAFAQHIRGGTSRRPTAQSVSPNEFSVGSYNINFPTTPVGGNSGDFGLCYFNCFFVGTADNCNGSGTIALSKGTAAPFSVSNFRKLLYSDYNAGSCTGTAVTFPVTLQSGEVLVQDFIFAPTTSGSFSDTVVYEMNGGPFVWYLAGATPNPPPAIVSFSATPPTIRPGQPVTLSWVVDGAVSVVIDNGVGSEPASGTVTVNPAATTTYTLTAMNSSSSASASATVTVITAPNVAVSSLPLPMLQLSNNGGASTQFTLTNAGGTSTSISLGQSGTFFTQSPISFTLAPGGSQVVTVTGGAEPSGAFSGFSAPAGAGVPSGLQIPITLLSAQPPSAPVQAVPATNRVDVAAASGVTPSGSVSFSNNGNAVLTGVLTSDVPWIIPQSGEVTIQPNSTGTFSFTIDRTRRADAGALLGSESGEISLTYLGSPLSKGAPLGTTPPPSVSTVSVVDTVQLTVATGTAPPPLAAGEVALFVPGVGHVTGSVGTFLSDLSILNPPGNPPVSDIRFFYTPTAAGAAQQSTSLPPVGGVSVALADVVKNVFGSSAQVGSLQIRSASAALLSVNTNIFNASNPAGTYGTTIPTFRSDRAVGAGGNLVLTGLRQDATGHTNLFIQEMSGAGAVTVQTNFLDPNGNSLGTRSDTVGPFALAQINNVVPSGAVAAILTNTSSNSATFLAYATPVDQASGDNWAIVDWSRQYGYAGGDNVIIPVAGVLQGANNTFFRTDVAITNSSGGQGSGTLRFYPRGGNFVDRTITLGPLQTNIVTNVIGSLFGASSGSVGYLLFTPATGTFAITSRTYTTVAGSVATFGTHVPTLPAAGSMTVGALRAIGSLQDSAVATVMAARPATFRTNFGLLETSGSSVTVRATLRFTYPAGLKVQGVGTATKDYPLTANQFMQINGIAADILGSGREALGDLRDLEIDFQVVSGTGAVAVYTSSTDNGTGDVILRTQ